MAITIDTGNYINNEYGKLSTGGASDITRPVSAQVNGAGSETLPAGSTVTGEIVDKNGNEVTIHLENDQTMTAKLQGDASIEVGMRLTFEVAKAPGGQTALRPLFSNLNNSSAAMAALKAAGLPVNNTTLAMTDRMMTEGMPVNRNALAEMFRNVSTHSNVSPESIVQMTKLGMPLTESNVIQFDNYRSFEHQIMNDLQSVAGGVADLLSEALDLVSSGNSSQMIGNMTAAEVVNEVINIIDPEALEVISPESVNVDVAAADTEIAAAESAVNAETVSGQTESTAEHSGIIAENNTGADQSTVISTQTQEAVAGQPGIPAENSTAAEQSTVITGQSDAMVSGRNADVADLVNPNLSLTPAEQHTLASDIQNILILAGESPDIHEPLNPSEVITMVKELAAQNPPDDIRVVEAEMSGYSEQQGEISDEGKMMNQALTDIEQLKEHLGQTGKEGKDSIAGKLGELIKSEGFSKLLKDSVKAQMSIKPEDVSKSGKIDELYDRIQKTSAKITELMENIGRGDSAVARSAGALTDNVNFMNQLNEFVGYVQLPLKMAGEDANGELYVYTNKKNLSNGDGNYSALLHLDMEHLGPMDIYVTMQDHTKVSTNFYLQTEELLDFIESHIDELTERLTAKGYNTSTKVSQRAPGEPITPITDEFTKDETHQSGPVVVSRMRFDVRA